MSSSNLQAPHPESIGYARLAFWGILVIGLVMRLIKLSTESLWLDEVASLSTAQFSLPDLFAYVTNYDTHPPLYALLQHFWISLFGTSEWWVRLPSVLFGVGTIALMYSIGKKLFDTQTGLLAAALLSLSSYHIAYSQEARMYAMLAFFSLASMQALWNLQRENNLFWSSIYVISTLGALFSQIIAVVLLVVHNACFFGIPSLRKAIGGWRWFKIQSFCLVPFLLWVPFVFQQFEAAKKIGMVGWIQQPTFGHLIEVLFEFFGGFPSQIHEEQSWWYFLLPSIILGILAVFLILQIVALVKTRVNQQSHPCTIPDDSFKAWCYLVLWATIPVFLPFLLSLTLVPIFLSRVCIAAVAPIFLILARQIMIVKHALSRRVLIVTVIICSLGSSIIYFSQVTKADWRAAVSHIDQRLSREGLVLIYPQYVRGLFQYYTKRTDLTVARLPLELKSFDNFRQKIESEIGRRSRFWFLCTYLRRDIENQFVQAFSSMFHFGEKRDFEGVTLYRFDVQPAPSVLNRHISPK